MLSPTEAKYEKTFDRLTNLPTLPDVANEQLQLSEEEAGPPKLARIIATDPGITANIPWMGLAEDAIRESVGELNELVVGLESIIQK